MYRKGSFNTYLSSLRVDKGCEYTHTSIAKPSGSFYVSPDDEDEFYDKYITALNNGEDLHLTEKHKHIGPVVIDLDFRFNETTNDSRRYNNSHLQKIVEVYAQVIRNFFEFGDDNTPMFYVMEKPEPVHHKDLIKDGIHIVVPNIASKPCVQQMIRRKVIPLLAPVFGEIGVANVVEDVIDEAVISRNNWQMYGSCKPDCKSYKVTYVYKCDGDQVCEDITETIDVNDYNVLVPLLSIRNKYDETKLKIEVWNEVKEFEQQMMVDRKRQMDLKLTKVNTQKNVSEDIDNVRRLVAILSVNRANKYEEWIRLGWCLRNIDYRLLDAWIDFSKKSSKYKDGECEQRWNIMRDDGLGIGSLHMWAKKDDPIAYETLMDNDLNWHINAACSKTHHDIAKVVHCMFKYEFVCASIKHNTWYRFHNNKWNECDSGHILRSFLSTKVSKKFCAASSTYLSKAASEDDQEKSDQHTQKGKKLLEIAYKLKECAFKESIMRECKELFYYDKFEDRLDSRCHLIGFENGVYDLEALEFREGRPEDYISITTKNNYIPMDANHINFQEMMAFIKKVLVKEDIRDYVLHVLSSFLNGNIREERFHIWTGSGANGKSKITELFESAFGEYCIKFPITLLTGKRAASNAPTAEVARSKGKRFACLQEPSEDEKLNVGLMKELSGGDKIQARPMFKDPIEFKPQFKMILNCNNLPTVPSDDGGTWRRIRVVEFTSKFVENPNPNEPREFKMDTTISSRFDEWKEHFMSLLIETYKDYIENGIKEPEDVLQCTKEYQRNNDTYAEFVAQKLTKSEMDNVSTDDVFANFKEWVKDNAPNVAKPSKTVMMKSLVKHLGKTCIVKGRQIWKGFMLVDNMIYDDDTDV